MSFPQLPPRKSQRSQWPLWSSLIVLSGVLHVVMFFSLSAIKTSPRPRVYKRAKFRIYKPKRRRPKPPKRRVRRRPPPRRKIKKKRPRPRPRKRRKRRRRKKKRRRPPPPPPPSNQTPPKRPPPRDAPPPRPVFGVTMSSLGKKGAGMKVRYGNTLMKDPDKRYTPPSQVRSYVAPRRPEPPPPRRRDFNPVPDYEVDKNPVMVSCPPVPYPARAKQMSIQAKVTVQLQIRKSGRVRRVRVVSVKPSSSKGFGLRKSVRRALRGCRFKPARYQGKAVDVVIRFIHRFKLDD